METTEPCWATPVSTQTRRSGRSGGGGGCSAANVLVTPPGGKTTPVPLVIRTWRSLDACGGSNVAQTLP
ncbi:hypothetical protein BO70DRAFT_363261 [Aspergillus heteromorphus CBS 117.55]|uniref:Uncharacterized protein n=1 Tax=Aspergillus heteromorphus CBS 117.55 TaxID=1448321 RepID=A0A317VX81_9EURO|nr:uncharacterized protein BO70DRAFT_363261 [Aspergillus heteromorphus CBS 117.55]PWY78385.1 hypothetical protein BO70DRAFT_363261 [Aspergillus heteromorphus CBS 117.55]